LRGIIRRYGVSSGLHKFAIAFAAAIFLTGPGAIAQTVTIAALGDSLTQGYGLPPDDGFVPQLDRWLTAHGADVTLINAGVSGDTTAGGLSRIGWTLDDNVNGLIVALGGNDLLRGIDPATSRANLRGILQAAQAKGVPVLLVGLSAPGNYGPGYKREFDAIYPDLAAKFGTLYYPDFVAAVTGQPDMRRLVQDDGLHPNAKGVKLIVGDMGPTVLKLVQAVKDAQ